jgi:hypothetical protein
MPRGRLTANRRWHAARTGLRAPEHSGVPQAGPDDHQPSERKDMHCAVAVNVALVPGGSRMNRMRACDAVRRAAGPHRQVQPFLSGCGLGSRRISPSIDQLCVRSRSDSTLRGKLPTARCGPRITFVSSKWTTRKVDQVPNTEAFANLPQLGSGGRKETAQQSIPTEPRHARDVVESMYSRLFRQ